VYRNNPCTLEALQSEIRSVVCNITEDEVSQNFLCWCQTCFNVDGHHFQQFKMQVGKSKFYLNVNQGVLPALKRFVEYSLLKHWFWLGKAVVKELLKGGSLRSDSL
jgi:hypothetical protein